MIDNLIAFRILYMLATPFSETKAFKNGIIDGAGKPLKKFTQLSGDEKQYYSLLHRVVFKIKRFLNKLPGGESNLKNFTIAYFLVKESILYGDNILDENLNDQQLAALFESDILLVEETITVLNFLNLFSEDVSGGIGGAGGTGASMGGYGAGTTVSAGAPANRTGAAVSTDEPVVRRKKKPNLARRKGNIHFFSKDQLKDSSLITV